MALIVFLWTDVDQGKPTDSAKRKKEPSAGAIARAMPSTDVAYANKPSAIEALAGSMQHVRDNSHAQQAKFKMKQTV